MAEDGSPGGPGKAGAGRRPGSTLLREGFRVWFRENMGDNGKENGNYCLGFRVYGSGSGVRGLGFKVLGFRV